MKSMKNCKCLFLLIWCFLSLSAPAQTEKFTELYRSHGDFNLKTEELFIFSEHEYMFIGSSRYDDKGPFWFTTDSGNTWRSKANHNFGLEHRKTVAYNLSTVVFYNDSLGLMMSLDSGLSFQKVPFPDSTPISEIWLVKGKLFVQSGRNIYLSTDTCKTFTDETINQPWGEVICTDKEYIAMHDAFQGAAVQSWDGGKTWSPLTFSSKMKGNRWRLIDRQTIYSWHSTAKNGLTWSFDRGATATNVDFPDGATSVTDVLFVNKSIGYALVNTDELYKTYNGGKTWELKHDFGIRMHYLDTFGNSVFVHTMRYRTFDPLLYVSHNGAEFMSIGEASKTATSIFPNPAGQKVVLAVPDGTETSYNLFNSQGQLLSGRSTVTNQFSIDISELKNGVYFIRLESDEKVEVHKLQVIH